MQIQNGNSCTIIKANGKKEVIEGTTPHFDKLVIDINAPKLSIEYAKGRVAVNEDFQLNYPRNQALARRLRRASKDVLVEALGGKVSTKVETVNGKTEKKILVTFRDQSVARL